MLVWVSAKFLFFCRFIVVFFLWNCQTNHHTDKLHISSLHITSFIDVWRSLLCIYHRFPCAWHFEGFTIKSSLHSDVLERVAGGGGGRSPKKICSRSVISSCCWTSDHYLWYPSRRNSQEVTERMVILCTIWQKCEDTKVGRQLLAAHLVYLPSVNVMALHPYIKSKKSTILSAADISHFWIFKSFIQLPFTVLLMH